MKKATVIILVFLMLCCIGLCSCSNRRRVTVIQNEQKKPEERKPVGSQAQLPRDYADDIRAEFTESELIVRYPDAEMTVPYEKIEEFSYLTSFDYQSDTLTDGEENEYEISAKMKAAQGDDYFLFIYKTTSAYIEIKFGSKVIVFNLESSESTKTCYDTLKENLG